MLFEIRNSTPEVSPPWIPARDAFLAGRTLEAWALANALRPAKALAIANDFLLNMEIARGCAAHREYAALARLAIRRFPDDPFVQLYHARMLLTRGRFQQGLEYLQSLESAFTQEQRGLWGSALANLYGAAGFEQSCQHWLALMARDPSAQNPLSLYQRSCANEGLHDWGEATRLAHECVAAAPNWSRARGHFAGCLLARGRIDDAREQFSENTRRGLEEATSEFSSAMLSFSVGDFVVARVELENLLSRWPQADFSSWVRRTLCILLFEVGDAQAAHEVARGWEQKLGLPELPKQADGRRKFLSLPLLIQNKNQCVPASVAMAAYAQGRSFDPNLLFKEMEGREGTAMWRMRQWIRKQGLMVAPIRLEKEAVAALLNHGVAMIGVLEGLFSSHVDVVCGYNDDLATIYVRDPTNWAPVSWPWEVGLARYALHGGLYAVFDAARTDLLALAESWRADPCGALIDLEEAVETGDLAGAESAYARIPDDSICAFQRDLFARCVVQSPKRFQARMKQYSDDEQSHRMIRFRALLALDSAEVKTAIANLLESEEGKAFGAGWRQFLQLNQLMADARWSESRELIDTLLARGGSFSRLWDLKSDVLAELGDQQGSAEALEKAIELEPLRISYRQKQLSRSAKKLSYTEYWSQFEHWLSIDNDRRQVIWARATALRECPDGKEYELAMRRAIDFYPRDPSLYSTLMEWYNFQGADDLEQNLRKVARERMPDIFTDESPSPAPGEPLDGEKASLQALPTDKAALVSLSWNKSDPRRSAAIAKLVELDRDGQLQWHDAARLLACRLLDLSADDTSGLSPTSLLPAKPSGPAPWFAGFLCDILTSRPISIPVASAVAEWLKELVDLPSYVDLWFEYALLLEKSKRIEDALVELQRMVERYPAHGSALYRLGVVKYQQGDLKKAKGYFERAHAADPGLYGALTYLTDLHDDLGDQAGALHYAQLLRKKLPYSQHFLADVVHRIRKSDSLASALLVLDAASEDFQTTKIMILRARLHFYADLPEQAESILARIPFDADSAPDSIFEDYLKLKLTLAQSRGDESQVLECCELGLRRWSDSNRLLELKADCLSKTDPQQSRALLQSIILKGEPEASTIVKLRDLLGDSPEPAIRELISSAEATKRENLAVLFSDAFIDPPFNALRAGFLNWSLSHFPNSLDLRWRLVNHYYVQNKKKDAVNEAREALRREPNHPGIHALLGRFLFETDAAEALPHLETACRLDRSTIHLFDLARCRQVVGDHQGSRDLHWEILEIDPTRMSSWTNLYLIAASSYPQDLQKLWDLLAPALKAGYGASDEYFYVAAVKIAVQLQKALPVEWLKLAVERYLELRIIDGYQDEKHLLNVALLAWQMQRPNEIPPKCVVITSWSKWYQARFKWPRFKWIPQGTAANVR